MSKTLKDQRKIEAKMNGEVIERSKRKMEPYNKSKQRI